MDVNFEGARLRSIFLAFIVVTAAGVATASATQPSPPESYYGTVTINGDPAPDGVVVTAIVDGEVKDKLEVTGGSYGGPGAFDQKLAVNATEDDTVQFRVAGLDTGQTDSVDPGEVTELNLTLTDTQSPTAAVGTDTTVSVGESVQFDATDSTDNGAFLRYAWDFDNDGSTDATGETTNHTFEQAGTMEVVLTVTDAAGNSDQASRTVTVEQSDTGGGGNNDGAGGGSDTTTSGDNTTETTAATTTSVPTTTQPKTGSSTTTQTTRQTSTTSTVKGTETTTVASGGETTGGPTTTPQGSIASPTGTEPTSTSVPGFGAGIAVVAVLAGGVLAMRDR
ncbi:PKD domain-containing protein [Halobacterium bonnevillei]|uniref:PKD domain-containing protein n=1 Tax=Halobacterium bonnevillei TaxID=2692200 RepID=A0A6B0SBK1_9EURY|nr:PKD domain-containing protein [Halobacterium bonnevillei]MXR19145.1 PKD domain-containing protein [Halobacterium bonnevillei]